MFSVVFEDEFKRYLIFEFFLGIVFLEFSLLICLSVISLGKIEEYSKVDIGEERHIM